MKDFSQKTALITGAANGVGRALAQALVKQGCQGLALVDIDSVALQKRAEELGSFPLKISTHVCDISDKNEWEKIYREVSALHEHLHILIHNAAVSIDGPLTESSPEDIDWLIDINLKGTMYGTRVFLPLLMREQQSHIVLVSSAAGLTGFPNKTLYCASKAGIKGFAEALMAELYNTSIHVSVVHPGPIKTNMLSRSRIKDQAKKEKMNAYLQSKGDSPEYVAKMIVNGILKDKFEILISSETKMLWWMKRFIPNLFVKMIGKYQDRLPA